MSPRTETSTTRMGFGVHSSCQRGSGDAAGLTGIVAGSAVGAASGLTTLDLATFVR